MGEEVTAGRCPLFGEYLQARTCVCMLGVCSKSHRVRGLRGPGRCTSEAGRCLRPQDVWELLWSRELMPRGKRDITQFPSNAPL